MSSVGSEVGGKVAGGTSVDQQQYPYFTSPGGVTPQQQSLGDYNYGQNLTESQGQFDPQSQPGGGASLSTMATQAAGGANMGKALDLASMSDTNQNAELAAYDNAIKTSQQNNENALAQNETLTQSLGQLAGQASSAAGLSGGLKAPLGASP